MSRPVTKTVSTGMGEPPGRRPCQCERCQGLCPVAIKRSCCFFFLPGSIIWPVLDAVIVRGVLIRLRRNRHSFGEETRKVVERRDEIPTEPRQSYSSQLAAQLRFYVTFYEKNVVGTVRKV